MSADTVKKRGVGDKILTTIETVGNKLPDRSTSLSFCSSPPA